jgi:hypothetical protein
VRGSIDEKSTTPQSRATASTDVRAARSALQVADTGPIVAPRRSVYVVAGGGLLISLLVAIIGAVVWVSDDSKHPVVQPNPSPSTTSAPTASQTAAVPTPLPVTTTAAQPPPVATSTAPTQAVPPPEVTAETITPPEPPRHRRLHELFPHLFPNG